MRLFPFLRISARLRRRGIPARVSSLAMVFQRSPLMLLLPEARIISTSGFSEALGWTITALAGLGAYDSVTGASQMTQLQPTPGSLTVNAVAGDPLNFVFQTIGTPHIPSGHQTTELPPGLVLTGVLDSTVDSITGTPAQAGTYPVTITAWELPGFRRLFFADIHFPGSQSTPSGNHLFSARREFFPRGLRERVGGSQPWSNVHLDTQRRGDSQARAGVFRAGWGTIVPGRPSQ